MCPIGYYNMIRSKNHIFDLRLRMVQHARKHGIRATARAFKCSRNTVRKWVGRRRAEGLRGLRDRSRAPHSCPHKLSPEAEKIIIRQAKKTPGFGARHLKHEFDLPYGVNSIARVKRENGITRRRRRKHQRRNDLRAIKQACKPFTRFQMDVKYLDDLPNYYPCIRTLNLPGFQYTIREIATGAQFLSYGDSLSVNYAEITIKRFLEHLRKCGIDTTRVHIQTDNGTEFEGGVVREKLAGFVHTIESLMQATHTYIPPGCSNVNADVESVHATIETDFFAKVTTYQLFYNLARKNGSRGYRSPLTILHERDPTLDPRLFMLLPCDLDRTFRSTKVGHHVPGLTDSGCRSPRIPFRAQPQPRGARTVNLVSLWCCSHMPCGTEAPQQQGRLCRAPPVARGGAPVKTLLLVLLTSVFAVCIAASLAIPAIADDGYIACSNSDDVIPFDLLTYALGTAIPLPGANPYPYDATMTPDGSEVWVPDASGDRVVVIDVAANTITHTIPVPEHPNSVVFTDDGTTALVSARDGDVVTLIKTSDYSVSGTLDVTTGGGGTSDGPGNMALDPVSKNIYALDWYGNTLFEIDSDASTVLRSADIGTNVWQLVCDPGGQYVYVTDPGPDVVRVIDRATLTEVRTVAVGGDPWGIDVTLDGSKLVVACEDDSNVYVIDTSDWSTTIVALDAGADPRDVDILDSELHAFVAGGDITGTDAVYVVELVGNTLESTILVGGNPNCMAVQPQMTSADVGVAGETVQTSFRLGCHPDPFNPKTVIDFYMPERGAAELAVYDVSGRLVTLLERGTMDAGEHRAEWDGGCADGSPAASGVYFVRLRTPGGSRAIKAVLLK